MDALAASAKERFAGELAAHVREKLEPAVRDLNDDELLDRVRIAMERAAAHGLARRVDVRGFVTLFFGIGPAFDRHPAVQAVLADAGIAAEEKIDYLIGRITPAEWEAARSLVADGS